MEGANRQNKKTYILHFRVGWVYQKVIRNNWVDPFVCETRFPCDSKSVLEFRGIGNGFYLTLMTFRQLTFALGVDDDDDDDKDGDEKCKLFKYVHSFFQSMQNL